jgi:putative redox protein
VGTLLKVSFKNNKGQSLHGRLHMPLGQVKTFAVYAHCFTCTKDIKAARNICQSLAERGIAALRFDFSGLGDSEGVFAETNFTSNVDDLVAAAAFLTDAYQAPEIIIGHSLGGTAALIAATKIPSIKAVSTINSPCHPRHVARHFREVEQEILEQGEAEITISERKFKIQDHFLEDLRSYDMETVFANLHAALLVFHAPHDDTVNIKNANHIFGMARHPKSFISLDSADHLILDPNDASYIAASIAAWSSRYIQFACVGQKVDLAQGQVIVAETAEGLYTQRIYAGRHILRADEPETVQGGLDLGPNPYDYLLAGLGACTSMTLRMYAQHKGLKVDKISVYLDHQKMPADQGEEGQEAAGKIDVIKRKIAVTGELTAQQRDDLLWIANKCPVHRTLQSPVKIITAAISPEEES